MSRNKKQIWAKMNSVRNRYGSDEDFILHMDEWPRTVKELIYGSEELMIRFGLVELLPGPFEGKEEFI